MLCDPRVSADSRRPGYPYTSAASKVRRLSAPTFVTMDDPDHRRYRDLLLSTFQLRRVEAMRPRVQELVDDLLSSMLANDGQVDLIESFALPLPSLVICELLGVPYRDREIFQNAASILFQRDTTGDEAARALTRVTDYVESLAEEKRRHPDDGVISHLTRATSSTAGLSNHEIASIGQLLLVAGHETTANMIALGTFLVLRDPVQIAMVRRNLTPEFIAIAVEEMLRFGNVSSPGRRRVALENIEIDGTQINEGDGIIAANELANFDPDTFDAPTSMRLDRDARNHLAFGYGVHQCLGQPIARLELQIALYSLFARFPTLQLARRPDELRFKNDMIVYGLYELPVKW